MLQSIMNLLRDATCRSIPISNHSHVYNYYACHKYADQIYNKVKYMYAFTGDLDFASALSFKISRSTGYFKYLFSAAMPLYTPSGCRRVIETVKHSTKKGSSSNSRFQPNNSSLFACVNIYRPLKPLRGIIGLRLKFDCSSM